MLAVVLISGCSTTGADEPTRAGNQEGYVGAEKSVTIIDPAERKPAPEIKGAVLGEDGKQISTADQLGKVVVLNVWGSWCGPCRAEAPDLQRFQERYGGPGFTVLGIDSRDLTEDGVAFTERFGMTYPQLRDGNGDTAHDYGTTGLPESFLVDPRGKVRLHATGQVDDAYLRDEVAPLLPEGGS